MTLFSAHLIYFFFKLIVMSDLYHAARECKSKTSASARGTSSG